MSSSSDRNLLFGILALQLEFISRESLIAGMQAWIAERQTPLAEHLLRAGALSREQLALLEPLVEGHIRGHHNDPQQSLAALSTIGSLRDDLQKLGDPQLDATLSYVLTGPRIDESEGRLGRTSSEGRRFRVVRPHAEGGLGRVYVAADEELGREVALKEIKPDHAHDAASRSRFTREAEITGGLEHPGIVPVYGLGAYADGRPFYAMRFVRGHSLKEAVEDFHRTPGKAAARRPRERGVQLRRLLQRFIDVCEAIDYAHSRGVLHRDLKPGNIMLGRYGETLVVDWGLAKPLGRTLDVAGHRGAEVSGPRDDGGDDAPLEAPERPLVPSSVDSEPTQLGSAIGTPAFMSPEQAAGRIDELGPASDVFSLGATLYMILCGRPPYAAAGGNEMVALARAAEFRSPRHINRSIPRALEAICLRAMAASPADRYASAGALASDIELWLADEPVRAYADSAAERAARWLRKNRSLALSIMVGLVVVAAVSSAAAFIVLGKNQVIEGQRVAAVGLAVKEQKARQEADVQKNAAIAAKNRANAVAHATRSSLMLREWNAANTFLARQLHEQQVPTAEDPTDRRGWEWWYHQRVMEGELARLSVSTANAMHLAIHPKGQLMAVASFDGVIDIFALPSGELVEELLPDLHAVQAIAFSPSGEWLAAGGGEAWGPDRSWLTVWRTDDWSVVSEFPDHRSQLTCLAFHPHDPLIASSSLDKTIRLWDFQANKTRHTLQAVQGGGPASAMNALAFSPDGSHLAACGTEPTIQVWDVATGQQAHELFLPGRNGHNRRAVAYDDAGRTIAVGCEEGRVCLWQPGTSTVRMLEGGGKEAIDSLAFRRGTELLAASNAGIDHYELESGVKLRTIRGTGPSMELDPLGWRYYTLGEGGIVSWDAGSDIDVIAQPTLSINLFGRSVWFFPDGQRLLRPLMAGFAVNTIQGRILGAKADAHLLSTSDMSLSADGTRAATTSVDNTAKVWETSSGKLLHQFSGKALGPTGVALNRDGTWLAISQFDGELSLRYLGQAPARHVLTQIEPADFGCVVFHPVEDRLVAGTSTQGEVLVFDVPRREIVWRIPEKAPAVHISFAQQGKSLIVGSADGLIEIWDWATRQLKYSYRPTSFTFTTMGLAYDATGPRLFAGTGATLRVIDLNTNLEVYSLALPDEVHDLALSPDGRRLAIVMKGSLRLLDSSPLTDAERVQREAMSLLRFYSTSPLTMAQMQAQLEDGVPAIREEVRQAVLKQLHLVGDNPQRFNNAAWTMARQPDRSRADYEEALRLAQKALELAPGSGSFLNTQGVCEYRLGRYDDALKTLEQSKAKNVKRIGLLTLRYEPSDVAFQAMCLHALGRTSEAQASLAQAKKSLQEDLWREQPEARMLVQEAEAVLAVPPANSPNP